MPTWLITLEVALMALNAMTPVIQAILQQIANQSSGPSAAQTAMLWSTYLNAVVKAELGA
jgi:hypothetical protein